MAQYEKQKNNWLATNIEKLNKGLVKTAYTE